MKKLTDAEKISRWLFKNPDMAVIIAGNAIWALYINEDDQSIIGEHEDFLSGSDYIDFMCQSFDNTGVTKLINKLQRAKENEPR